MLKSNSTVSNINGRYGLKKKKFYQKVELSSVSEVLVVLYDFAQNVLSVNSPMDEILQCVSTWNPIVINPCELSSYWCLSEELDSAIEDWVNYDSLAELIEEVDSDFYSNYDKLAEELHQKVLKANPEGLLVAEKEDIKNFGNDVSWYQTDKGLIGNWLKMAK